MQRIKWAPWWAWCAVGALLAIGAAVLAYETRGTTFWADEWNWILTRRGGGAGTYLDPHNSHLSLVPVVIYKLLFAIVGLRHYWPYRAVLIAVDLGCATLVFLYARARVGSWLALVATAMILFFGPGWQDLLWPFQIGYLIAVGAGVAALLLLDRRDRAGDIGACVALVVSVASSGVGIALWLGALVDVAQRRRWRELWIVAIPIVLYGVWWLGYEQNHIYAHAFVLVPKFLLHAIAGALSGLAGLAKIDVQHDTGTYLTWGIPLLVVALAVVLWLWRARGFPRIAPRVVTLVVIALAFWVLTGIGRAYVRVGPLVLTETGSESRYLYVSALLILLLAVELARGYRPSLLRGRGDHRARGRGDDLEPLAAARWRSLPAGAGLADPDRTRDARPQPSDRRSELPLGRVRVQPRDTPCVVSHRACARVGGLQPRADRGPAGPHPRAGRLAADRHPAAGTAPRQPPWDTPGTRPDG